MHARAFGLIAALALLGSAALPAQRRAAGPPPERGLRATIHRLNAEADSAHFGWELWAGSRIAQTGDSLPGVVGVGKLIGSRFSFEISVSAHSEGPSGSQHLEGDFTAGVTAAIFPGSTNVHGEGVYGDVINHRVGTDWQWGVQFGTLLRVVGASGISARTGPYYRYLAARGPLGSNSGVGAVVLVAFNL